MAKLSSLLKSKTGALGAYGGNTTEQNVERGKVWNYASGNICGSFCNGFCWIAPAAGTVVIEIWGASGSGARMCCCGGGLPGNPGAYAKKTITVAAGCYICGQPGQPCMNGDALCFRGCSDSSGLVWFGCSGQSGCLCAQGGQGGTTFCSTGTSLWCCFYANGFCGTFNTAGSDNCGLICNYGAGSGRGWIAYAFGGDINCCGGFSCTGFWGCYPQCICQFTQYVQVSPGLYSKGQSTAVFATENTDGQANWSGQGWHQQMHAISALSRWPSQGVPYAACWNGALACGCYENEGCVKTNPIGVPATPAFPCGDVRDEAHSGGEGAVRIKFY
jgi:hypothetical protein